MTKDELTKIVVENTKALALLDRDQKSHKELLNDHLHEHYTLRFWLFTFLITTNITSLGTIITLLIKLG